MLRFLARLLVGILAGIGVLSVAVVIWLVSGGMSARRTPGAAEAWVAVQMRSVAIPAAERKMTDPAPTGPLALKVGLERFAERCATCHGADGAGQADIARGLYPRPPDLRGERTQSLSDGEIFHIINDGVRFTGMPALNYEPKDVWALVRFVRRLPQLSKQEMDRMNAIAGKGK